MDTSNSQRKLVEVFIDTDSESESHTSSEIGVASDEIGVASDDGSTEETLAGEEVGVAGDEEGVADDGESHDSQCHDDTMTMCAADAPFPELEEEGSGFNLYDRDEDVFRISPARNPVSPAHARDFPVDLSMSSVIAGDDEDSSDPSPSHSNLYSPQSTHSPHSKPYPSDPPHSKPYPSDPPHSSRHSPLPSELRPSDLTQQLNFSPQSPEDAKRNSTPPDEVVSSPRYCICKDPLWDSAMIECHKCSNYFHGSCVGISRQKASLLRHFYCPVCIDKNSDLVTEFESRELLTEQRLLEVKRPVVMEGRKYKNKKHSRR